MQSCANVQKRNLQTTKNNMKRIPILLFFCLFLFITGQAQVSKTINVTTPGTLSTLLTSTELSTVTNLTVTGNIDARDFKTMKDKMPKLANIDISTVIISYYKGYQGTEGYSDQESSGLIEYAANEIPKYAFFIYYSWPSAGKTNIKSISLPSSITSVGENAFAMCTGLSGSLKIPSSVVNIAPGAFLYCTGYTGSLIIPSSVDTIGNQAFSGCSGFTGSLIIPSTVKVVNDNAFRYCTGFNGTLSLSDSLTYIGESAFSECSGLKGSVTIPKSIITIGGSAFANCSGFNGSLTLGASVRTIGGGAFMNCSGLKGTLSIPSSVSTIGGSAFSGCSGFTGSLIIPSSVTTVGEQAFQGCSGFNGSLTLSSLVTAIEASTFDGCIGLTGSISIPASTTIIRYGAFKNCKGFNGSLTIPSSVSWIESYAFSGCSGLTGSLTLPTSVHTINDHAFFGCSGFNGNLILPPTLYSINTAAFTGCSGFTGSLKIPEFEIEYGALIGDSAFAGCKSFNGTLSLPKTIPYPIGNAAFSGCSGFTGSLIIPTAAKSIGISAFSGCSGFNGSLSVSSSIATISNNAFKDCIGLNETLTIPASVTSIGSNAFMNCSNLTRINAYGNNPSGITLGTTVFSGIPKTSCSLFVPVTKKSLYAVAAQWKDFITISEGIPTTVTTGTINSVYSTNPTGNGNITNIDPNDLTHYGVVWSTTSNPTIDLTTKKEQGTATATGPFTYSLSGLTANTTYFVKAYATNSSGTSYGEQTTFTTPTPVLPSPSAISLTGFKTAKGVASAIQTFTIGGTELASNLVITAPAGFEIQQLGASYFVPTMSLIPVSGVVANRTIAVRIAASAQSTGKISSNIVCSTAWAADQLIAVSGEITQKQLTVTNPTIVTNKMVDGNTNAVVTIAGTLQGVDAVDAGNVGVSASATYDNANVGTNKTITVVFTLTGSAKDKYLAPVNYVITNAKISDYITLSPLSTPSPGCEGSTMDLPFTLLTGTPTQYKITFNAAALSAGMKNVAYMDLSNANAGGVLTFSVPNNTKDGIYQGTVKMKNELYIESIDYPFTFTINVSADYIRTKFNDIILFDNSEKRFTGYQWYINGIEIPGATKQFYSSPIGLIGNYSLKLTTTDGKTLYTCPKVLNLFSVKAQVSTFPNPVKENENYTVQVTGLNEDQLKDAELSVFNMQGICVYKSRITGNVNNLNLPVNGAYVGHLTATGIDNVFKIIVVK